ncbi:hypothetical protein CYMTET_24332 [Cymbomonas tetramitiformis]|uniref:Uncharacterized protein n=1 Tax=Cymbomonas tetramitiformis TaxID=36881 RepID=A0AAE0FWM0_9CHLO|nr:hypothetical protein CYMTET_24332 [Cymbomonas tetramitiformis]
MGVVAPAIAAPIRQEAADYDTLNGTMSQSQFTTQMSGMELMAKVANGETATSSGNTEVSLTILSPTFLQPMVQKLTTKFTLEFGAPATGRGNYKVVGDDDTPPFKKTKFVSSSPSLTPMSLFASRAASGAAADAGPSVGATAPILPTTPPEREPNHIVATTVNLRENVAKAKPSAQRKIWDKIVSQ